MSAYKLLRTGAGSIGEYGTEFTERFFVTAPDPKPANWHPQADDDLVRLATRGTELPGRKGAFCTGYREEEQFDKTHWVIQAIYGPPSALDPGVGGAWRVEITGSLDTAFTEVVRLTPEERRGEEEPQIVGPYAYKKIVFGPQPDSSETILFTGTSDGKAIALTIPKDPALRTRTLGGMDYYPPAMVITCSRRFEDAKATRTAAIASAHGRVNSESVNILGRASFTRGQLMLADYEITEVVGDNQDQPIEHSIRIVFVARPDTWQHVVIHTYSDANETGTAAAIVKWGEGENIGQPVEEEIRRQFWFDFNGFVEGL